MTNIFASMIITSVVGTFLAVLILIMRPFTRKVFSAGWHYYIWLVVLLVMMIPIRVELPTLSEVPEYTESKLTVKETSEDEILIGEISGDHTEVVVHNSKIVREDDFDYAKRYIEIGSYMGFYVWFAIAALLFITKIIRYMLFVAKMKRHSETVLCSQVKDYTKRNIETRVCDSICTPLVVGIFKPVLLLPCKELSGNQLRNILSHEMTHVRRNDILYKWLVNIVKCIHWFNPAIYFISRQIDMDCEISCDLSVVKNMNSDEEMGYIDTILSLLSHRKSKPVSATTAMTGKKNALKKRFTMIKNKIAINKKAMVVSLILAIVLLVSALFLSGVLNGTIFKSRDNQLVNLSVDIKDGNEFNMLLVGVDNNDRADTIMLFNVSEDSMRVVSVPRNTVYDGKKISDIIAMPHGDQAVIDLIRKSMSLPVHYYARINLSVIKEIVDSTGGIDFDVPMDMVYDDPYQNLHINLKKGRFTLNGEGVTQLLQYRQGYPQGDFTRIELHQKFIKEFIKQKINVENIGKATEVFMSISDNIKTNYPLSNLISDLTTLMEIPAKNISFEIIQGTAYLSEGELVYDRNDNSTELRHASTTIIWPVNSRKISSKYGERVHPLTGEKKMHKGVDILSEENSPVVSSIDGKVTDAGYKKDIGNYVVIENESGIKVLYGHLSSIDVSKGDIVSQKTTVGKVGKTGNATGANLHFEIYLNGKGMDPETILVEDKPQSSIKNRKEEASSAKNYDDSEFSFEHKTLENYNINKMQQMLFREGSVETTDGEVNLSKNHYVGDYTQEDTQIIADENGNISLYLTVNMDTLFDVRFYDRDTREYAGEYRILANNENAYTFYGFEKGRTYNMELTPKTKNDWVIEGDYIVY